MGMSHNEVVGTSKNGKVSRTIDLQYLINNIDDLIDEWHESDSESELYEYLGMTFEEYTHWVETGKFLIID